MEPSTGVVRPRGVRRPFLALVLLLLGLALVPAGSPASASCAGPMVDVPRTLVPGETVEISGDNFLDGCQDSMGCPVGCNAGDCEYDDPPPVPTPDVTLTLSQRGRTWDLGTVDADEDGKVRWSFTVPADVRRGRAVLSWGGDPEGVGVRIRATAG